MRKSEIITRVQLPERHLANLGLNGNPGFFFFLSKALSRITFSILFRVSSHQVVASRQRELNWICFLSSHI